jgi:hypothetical protein
MVTPDQAGARAQVGIIGILNPLPNGRSPPEPTGARGKAGLIEVDNGLLGLLSLVVALDEVFAPGVALRLKSLGVQQRFFTTDSHLG